VKKTLAIICILIVACALVYNLYPGKKIPAGITVDKIVVLKSERKLEAYSNGMLVVSYKIALGKSPVGAKEYEGDKKTP
jgi:murein L,D-transpeptidase YafK